MAPDWKTLLFCLFISNPILPFSSKVTASSKNAMKNVIGEERVTPLSCRQRSLAEGSLKHLAATDLSAERTSGERTEEK